MAHLDNKTSAVIKYIHMIKMSTRQVIISANKPENFVAICIDSFVSCATTAND